MDRSDKVVRGEGRKPGGVGAADRADLGDDGEPRRIGMERLGDDLIGDVRPVEVAGVDMVDAAFDRLAQDRHRFGAVLRRSEYAGACELHGAVAHAMDGAAAEAEGGRRGR